MLNAILQGFIQGITEFLPISSSGHLLVIQHLLTSNNIDKDFITGLHLATGFAILWYFHKKIFKLIQSLIKFKERKFNKKIKKDIELIKSLALSTLITIIIGFIIKLTKLEEIFNNLLSIGIISIIFSILLYLSFIKHKNLKNKITTKDALIIGASQMLAALFPGASRFGVTFTTCLLLGINKKKSLEFIFFLSIPVIFLASIQEIFTQNLAIINIEFTIAFLIAFFTGILAIFIVQQIIKKLMINFFTIYRILFGLFCLYLNFTL